MVLFYNIFMNIVYNYVMKEEINILNIFPNEMTIDLDVHGAPVTDRMVDDMESCFLS